MISAKPVFLVAVLAIAHLCGSAALPAQGVTVKATALTELSASVAYPMLTNTLPAGTDITVGTILEASNEGGRAKLTYSVEETSSHILARLKHSLTTAGGLAGGGRADDRPSGGMDPGELAGILHETRVVAANQRERATLFFCVIRGRLRGKV